MFRIIRNRKIWYSITISSIVISIAALFIFGLRISVDYSGGALLDISSSNPDISSIIETSLESQNISTYQVKPSGDKTYTIKIRDISNDEKNKLVASIQSKATDAKEVSFDNIGPSVGKDLTNKSILSVFFASLAIILYISFSFRRVPKPLSSWKFGLLAVIALAHDLLVTVGFVAILGHFFVWMEVDTLFITALLTIMGFSVHDTIVIYDRLRENFIRNRHKTIEEVSEESINQTMARSINTSITTIIVLFALLLLGGTPIRHFILTLMFGIFIGTYSSIFIAAPLVVSWHSGKTDSK